MIAIKFNCDLIFSDFFFRLGNIKKTDVISLYLIKQNTVFADEIQDEIHIPLSTLFGEAREREGEGEGKKGLFGAKEEWVGEKQCYLWVGLKKNCRILLKVFQFFFF